MHCPAPYLHARVPIKLLLLLLRCMLHGCHAHSTAVDAWYLAWQLRLLLDHVVVAPLHDRLAMPVRRRKLLRTVALLLRNLAAMHHVLLRLVLLLLP